VGINLWDPSAAGLSVGSVLITAFLLGIVHGITPDEHTWPITFSYAIGSYSTRKGMLSGFIFSLSFTVQRAIGAVLAYLALARWMQSERIDLIVYVIVGAAMAFAGGYVLRIGRVLHLHPLAVLQRLRLPAPISSRFTWLHAHDAVDAADLRSVTPGMAAIHGFIAGWGFGAFATILYTVLVPAMPNVATSWIPGAVFGLGTVVVQAAAGAFFGRWMRRRNLPEAVIAQVARRVAGMTLWWGGIVFVLAGIVGLAFPQVASWQIQTPIQVHNLDHLGIGFILVIVVVGVIGGTSLVSALRRARRTDVHERSRLPQVQQGKGQA